MRLILALLLILSVMASFAEGLNVGKDKDLKDASKAIKKAFSATSKLQGVSVAVGAMKKAKAKKAKAEAK